MSDELSKYASPGIVEAPKAQSRQPQAETSTALEPNSPQPTQTSLQRHPASTIHNVKPNQADTSALANQEWLIGCRISRSMEWCLAFILGGCLFSMVHFGWKKLTDRPVPMERMPVVDLNTASRKTLAQIPGIGPARAAQIEALRDQYGPFTSVEELQPIPGIGPTRREALKPFVHTSTDHSEEQPPVQKKAPFPARRTKPSEPPKQKININQATLEELQALPSIGPVLAERIIAERSRVGYFQSLSDLKRIKGIKDKTLDKISPYLEVKVPPRVRPDA